MTAPTTSITPTIPFGDDGVHHGHLQLPYSHDAAAYGSVMIPIAVIANGPGPTVLMSGGNHGDEYAGPTSLIKLANSLDPATIRGRVIIVPTMNQPAFAAGTRTSPIDRGNLNRSFPGRPDGTHTERIADYMAHHLLPLSDFVVDIHDGGRSLEFVPTVSSPVSSDAATTEASRAAADAFGAPYATQLVEIDTLGMWEFYACETGRPFVNTEIGGTGGMRPEHIAITDAGLHNLLVHWGVLQAEPIETPPSVRYSVPEVGGYVMAQVDGLIEWIVELGAPIEAGQVIARVHEPRRLGVAPVDHHATVDGFLAMRHHPGLISMGDAVAMQGVLA